MAMLGSIFKAEDVQEDQPVPAGEYLCQVVKSTIKPTKAGNGKRLILNIKIIEGEYADNVIFESLNIENPNPKAEQIAHRQLKQLCEAVEVTELEDTAELHGIDFVAKTKIQEAKDGWPAKCVVQTYMHADCYDE